MASYNIEVKIMPRATILDPQGKAVEHALGSLNFKMVSGLRVGRNIRFTLERPDEQTARDDAQAMCEQLLANPVTEDFELSVEAA